MNSSTTDQSRESREDSSRWHSRLVASPWGSLIAVTLGLVALAWAHPTCVDQRPPTDPNGLLEWFLVTARLVLSVAWLGLAIMTLRRLAQRDDGRWLPWWAEVAVAVVLPVAVVIATWFLPRFILHSTHGWSLVVWGLLISTLCLWVGSRWGNPYGAVRVLTAVLPWCAMIAMDAVDPDWFFAILFRTPIGPAFVLGTPILHAVIAAVTRKVWPAGYGAVHRWMWVAAWVALAAILVVQLGAFDTNMCGNPDTNPEHQLPSD